MSTIDTIVFDLGGVLIDWNPRYVYQTLFETEAEIDEFLATVCTGAWNAEQDRGRSLCQGTQSLIEQYPQWDTHIWAYYGRWPEMLGGPIYETVDLLQSLKQGGQYRLLALTNWSMETFPFAKRRYEFLTWFEGILVSGEEGVIKPEPAIYQLLFERYGVDPAKAVFLDDSEKNVVGAREVGLHAIQVKSPMQLREDLADMLS